MANCVEVRQDRVDLWSPEFQRNPYPVYEELRNMPGLYWLPAGRGRGSWLLSRYQDVSAILRGNHTSTDLSAIIPMRLISSFDRSMLNRDPPEHTCLRSRASGQFKTAGVAALEGQILDMVTTLLDRVLKSRDVDFVAEFAEPLPAMLIAELVGAPRADYLPLLQWSKEIMSNHPFLGTIESRARRSRAIRESDAYCRQLIAARREAPRDDIVTTLLAAGERGDPTVENEAVGTMMALLLAGHLTTASLLANGLMTLLNHPEQLQMVRRCPHLAKTAVDEMLRFESPAQRSTFRVATKDIEIAGCRIAAGEEVSALLGAANRDPSEFPRAHEFDVTRDPNRHVAFGAGIHFCLGGHMARVVGRIALREILDRTRNIRNLSDEPAWAGNTFFVRRLVSLPLAMA